MEKTIIGLVGCGFISNIYLRDLLRLCPEIEVKAVSDLLPDLAKAAAAKFNIPFAMTVDELLSDPDISIAVNLTPPLMHTEVNKKILNSGKHLFCEKPFALTMADALDTIRLADEKKLTIGCAPDSFLGSSIKSCKKLLESGMIGKPLYVCMNMMTSGVEGWHPRPEHYYTEGGGPLFDMAGYYFSSLVDLLGPVEAVSAFSAKGFENRIFYSKERLGFSFPAQVDTHYSLIARLCSGVIVSANFSFDIWKTNMPLFEIYGTEGTLEVPDPNMHGGTPRLFRKEQKLAENYGGENPLGEDSVPIPELYQNLGSYVRCLGVKDLAAAIKEGRLPKVSANLALHITEIILAIMESAKNGSMVKIESSSDKLLPRGYGG